jgi:hypothetical protein
MAEIGKYYSFIKMSKIVPFSAKLAKARILNRIKVCVFYP